MRPNRQHGFEDQDQDGDRLRDHFQLAQAFGGEHPSARRGHGTEARDGKLPRQDENDQPAGGATGFDEHHERRKDEQLVGDGIEQLAQISHFFATPRHVAVEPVRERRHREDGGRANGEPGRLADGEESDQDRDEGQSQ